MTLTRPRLTMATVMVLVITAGSASALFARLAHHLPPIPPSSSMRYEIAGLFVAAIGLTGVAIAARKRHSPYLAMLQITVACLAYLILISVAEISRLRPVLYWYQIAFAVLVVIPLVVRRIIKLRMEKSPRRAQWMKTCESLAFAFLNMILVLIGVGAQTLIFALVTQFMKF